LNDGYGIGLGSIKNLKRFFYFKTWLIMLRSVKDPSPAHNDSKYIMKNLVRTNFARTNFKRTNFERTNLEITNFARTNFARTNVQF